MTGQGSQTRRQMRRAHKKKQRQQQARSPRPWEATISAPPRPYTPLRAAVVPPAVQAITLTDFSRARRMEENYPVCVLLSEKEIEQERVQFEQRYGCTPEAFLKRWPDLADEHVADHAMIYCDALFLRRKSSSSPA